MFVGSKYSPNFHLFEINESEIPLFIGFLVGGSNPANPTIIIPVVFIDLFGMWRSLVAHTHGVRGVAGSNPVIPT